MWTRGGRPDASVLRRLLLLSMLFCSLIPGCLSVGIVKLDSIEIFTTHEVFGNKPTVYFYCREENQITLPDVKESNVVYSFKGVESWQPLTELVGDKCKRCGLYEKDTFKDDVFDEWELCPDDFVGSGSKNVHFKRGEFNATFSCPDCKKGSVHTKSKDGNGTMRIVVPVLVTLFVVAVVVTVSVVGFKFWQKKKREKDRLRFLKLFEEGDDSEDELGLGV